MLLMVLVFFFKQKTAYEMRISDWSSDVCSSDLRRSCCHGAARRRRRPGHRRAAGTAWQQYERDSCCCEALSLPAAARLWHASVMSEHKIGRASCRERVCQYV